MAGIGAVFDGMKTVADEAASAGKTKKTQFEAGATDSSRYLGETSNTRKAGDSARRARQSAQRQAAKGLPFGRLQMAGGMGTLAVAAVAAFILVRVVGI